ncbi:MAG: hypothetical protein J0J04_07940 [Microbacterium sp.]|uniref:hypothetical protein n=1 Tax=Microbacterium sp. TaxID=51671 RepID=UPI001AC8AB89|nr:hypothetical protein [Microbacterium sp.]MBN9214730.1 hypothetical protein [Microbacterium sp.]
MTDETNGLARSLPTEQERLLAEAQARSFLEEIRAVPDSERTPNTSEKFAGAIGEPTIDTAPQNLTALLRLAFARKTHRDLLHAEADARVNLAAAILAMDEAADQPGRHNLLEQQAVNDALTAYGQALANVLRGEVQE